MLGRIERARLETMPQHIDASAKTLFTALAALTLMLTLLAGACSDAAQSPTPTLAPPTLTPTPTPINPQAIVDESAAAMAALNSFRFALTHNDGGAPLALGMLLTDASGSVGVPDRVALDFNGVSAGRFAVSGSVIAVGEDVYMTNPLTGDWHQVGGDSSPLNFFNPAQGIADIMAQMRDATLVSHDAAAYRIDGMLPADALASLFGAAADESVVRAALTIDKPSLRLSKAVLDGRITPNEADGLARTITLFDFNRPVNIAPPN